MPEDVKETDEVTNDTLDVPTTKEVATTVKTVAPKQDAAAPVADDFEERVEAAVQARLAEQEESAKREEAIRQGEFERLYKESQDKAHELEIKLWKNQALAKYKLSDDFFEALSGQTEDEILKSAKKLKTAIDAEVAQATQTVTPPPAGKRQSPRDVSAPDVTRDILKNAFVPRRTVRH